MTVLCIAMYAYHFSVATPIYNVCPRPEGIHHLPPRLYLERSVYSHTQYGYVYLNSNIASRSDAVRTITERSTNMINSCWQLP